MLDIKFQGAQRVRVKATGYKTMIHWTSLHGLHQNALQPRYHCLVASGRQTTSKEDILVSRSFNELEIEPL